MRAPRRTRVTPRFAALSGPEEYVLPTSEHLNVAASDRLEPDRTGLLTSALTVCIGFTNFPGSAAGQAAAETSGKPVLPRRAGPMSTAASAWGPETA
ncbi:protein of unknown function [Pararobbsia alpina]